MVAHIVNVPNATGLYTLKWQILCYIYLLQFKKINNVVYQKLSVGFNSEIKKEKKMIG